jgi:hypothetical protein
MRPPIGEPGKVRMKRCPACQREHRKGALAIVVTHGQAPARKRVCLSCASAALAIVAVSPPPVPKRPPPEPRDDRVLLRQLGMLARAALAIANDPSKSAEVRAWSRGRAEGFEGAAQAVKRARP